jgi:sulfur transfer protein SufE
MVLQIYNGKTKDEILATDPNILENLGIAGLLTPGRQNGIGNLIKKVYEYAGQ